MDLQAELTAQKAIIESIDPQVVASEPRNLLAGSWQRTGKTLLQSNYRQAFMQTVLLYARQCKKIWVMPMRKAERKAFFTSVDKARVAVDTGEEFGEIFYAMMGGAFVNGGLIGRFGLVSQHAVPEHGEGAALSQILLRMKVPCLLATDMICSVLQAYNSNPDGNFMGLQRFMFDLGSKLYKLTVDCDTGKTIAELILKFLPRIVCHSFFTDLCSQNIVLFQSVMRNLDALLRKATPKPESLTAAYYMFIILGWDARNIKESIKMLLGDACDSFQTCNLDYYLNNVEGADPFATYQEYAWLPREFWQSRITHLRQAIGFLPLYFHKRDNPRIKIRPQEEPSIATVSLVIQKSVISELLPVPNQDPLKPVRTATKGVVTQKKSSKKQRYNKSTVTMDDMVYDEIDSEEEQQQTKTQIRLANEAAIEAEKTFNLKSLQYKQTGLPEMIFYNYAVQNSIRMARVACGRVTCSLSKLINNKAFPLDGTLIYQSIFTAAMAKKLMQKQLHYLLIQGKPRYLYHEPGAATAFKSSQLRPNDYSRNLRTVHLWCSSAVRLDNLGEPQLGPQGKVFTLNTRKIILKWDVLLPPHAVLLDTVYISDIVNGPILLMQTRESREQGVANVRVPDTLRLYHYRTRTPMLISHNLPLPVSSYHKIRNDTLLLITRSGMIQIQTDELPTKLKVTKSNFLALFADIGIWTPVYGADPQSKKIFSSKPRKPDNLSTPGFKDRDGKKNKQVKKGKGADLALEMQEEEMDSPKEKPTKNKASKKHKQGKEPESQKLATNMPVRPAKSVSPTEEEITRLPIVGFVGDCLSSVSSILLELQPPVDASELEETPIKVADPLIKSCTQIPLRVFDGQSDGPELKTSWIVDLPDPHLPDRSVRMLAGAFVTSKGNLSDRRHTTCLLKLQDL